MHLFDLPRNGILALRNGIRSLRRKGLDVVVLSLEGSFPERTPRRTPLPFPISLLPIFPSEASLEEMQEATRIIGADDRVRAVVFRIGNVQAGSATLHTLRGLMKDLREKGKHTVAWVPSADTWDYYLASACNEIIMPPSGRLNAVGLRTEALFLKETLATAGIEADLESIAEYKVTPDMFRRTSMTEPHRQMLEAILDSAFDHFASAIEQDRGMAKDRVVALIDEMPLTPDVALEAGLIDATLYEDELAGHLTRLLRAKSSTPTEGSDSSEPSVSLTSWGQAVRWLKRPASWTTRKRIGVVSLEGMIIPGKSRRMPTPLPLPVDAQAGAETLTAALRQAEADPRIVTVIFHVDSPGGSALASDLIWRQVRRLQEKKPVVALLGEQAASGGYYVASPASRIVARPTTMTGSIGIWGGKFVVGPLYDRLGVGHREMQRGARADLYSEFRPFDDEEREQIRLELGTSYARFKDVVAEGRGMAENEVEDIARGRVWTGEQAVDIGLADELGGFETALAAAKELAGLEPETEYTVVQITPPRQEVMPQPFPADGDSGWAALQSAVAELTHEHVWAMAPWTVRLRD